MSTYNLKVPEDLMPVLHYYEDTCVMGCCGVSALDLNPQRIVDGMADHGLAWAERGLVALDGMLPPVQVHVGPVQSDHDGFGESWDSAHQALQFLTELRDSLSRAILHAREHGFETPIPSP